jgi:hypothetical protein
LAGRQSERMTAMALTRAERKLQAEVQDIALLVDMDFWAIEENYEPDARKYKLKWMLDKIVRGEVIYRYTYIDELLTCIICDYYFRRPKKNVSYQRLWRTKHFRVFVHYLMDETFIAKKLAMVQAILKVPTNVSSSIMRINDVRNALAHSLFPYNRRRYRAEGKVLYKGVDLFSREGVQKFHEDYLIAEKYFSKKVFG